MKKLLLSICISAMFASNMNAQAPDYGFETWAALAPPFVTVEDPTGWASLNALTAVGTTQSLFKETTSPAVGTISAKLMTVKIQGATLPNPYGGTLDTAGILAAGKINLSPPGITYGYGPFAARPGVLSFQTKYTPVGSDSAFVLAYLTHYNTGTMHRDTIASGKYATGAATSSYAVNNLAMTYYSAFAGTIPDSMQIFISSSVYSHDGANIGSTFYIDDVKWSAFVGVNELDPLSGTVTLYPNPANSNFTLESSVDAQMVEVMDVTGRKIGVYSLQSNKVFIETTGFAKGSYLYRLMDKDGKVINKGKFEVAH